MTPKYRVGDLVWLGNRFDKPAMVEIKSIVACPMYDAIAHNKICFEYQVALMNGSHPLGIELRQVWQEGDLFPERRALLEWQVGQLQSEIKELQQELDSRVAALETLDEYERLMGRVDG